MFETTNQFTSSWMRFQHPNAGFKYQTSDTLFETSRGFHECLHMFAHLICPNIFDVP